VWRGGKVGAVPAIQMLPHAQDPTKYLPSRGGSVGSGCLFTAWLVAKAARGQAGRGPKPNRMSSGNVRTGTGNVQVVVRRTVTTEWLVHRNRKRVFRCKYRQRTYGNVRRRRAYNGEERCHSAPTAAPALHIRNRASGRWGGGVVVGNRGNGFR